MDLPLVDRSYGNVDVIGFYHRATLNVRQPDESTIVYSDRTEYTAYAERCRDSTISAKTLSKERLASMNLREFAETVTHQWIVDRCASRYWSADQTQISHARLDRRTLDAEAAP